MIKSNKRFLTKEHVMQIILDIPEQLALEKSLPEVGATLKLYAALAMFQAGKLSAGAATELAGISRYDFMAACKKNHIPTVNYSPEDLHAELEGLLH